MARPCYWEDADAVCPYYKDNNRGTIRCEGLSLDDGSSVMLNFSRSGERAWHQSTYCRASCEYCPIYRAINAAKYDEGESD